MQYFQLLLLLVLPAVSSGCCTLLTISAANNAETVSWYDSIERVEKAAVTPDNRLLLYAEGNLIGSSEEKKFVLTIPLDEADRSFFKRAEVPRSALTKGWDATTPQDANLAPVTVSLRSEQTDQIWSLKWVPPNAETNVTGRTLLVFQDEDHQENIIFVYVDPASFSSPLKFKLDGETELRPGRYYLTMFFLLPVAIPMDIATSPIQLLVVWIKSSAP